MRPHDKSSVYRQLDLQTRIESATPLQLVQMQYQGLLASLLEARGAMERKDHAQKGKMMTRALAIVSALRDTLDKSVEGELPVNLDRLYDYWQRQLINAHAHNDQAPLDEVIELVKTVKSGWDEVSKNPDSVQK